MKKFLKKSVAIILTLVMLFSLNVSVFATNGEALVDYEELYVGESAYAYISGFTDFDWFKFTPETDGKYVFESETADTYTRAYLYAEPDQNSPELGWSDGGFYAEGNFKIAADLIAGETYYLAVSVGSDFSATFPISVRLSPISDVQFETIELYPTDGTQTTDDEGNEYYHYNWRDKLNYIVMMNNGDDVQDCNLSFWYMDRWYDFEYHSDDQGAHNQWQVGATYSIELSVDGVTSNLYVHINESPIESIDVDSSYDIIEHTKGSYTRDFDYNTGEYSDEYYCYNDWFDYDFKFTINFKDGTVAEATGHGFEYNGEWYNLSVETDEQDYENQWTVGNTYNATFTALGYAQDISLNIVESPIDYIEYLNNQYIENDERIGSFTNGYNQETDEYDLEYFEYEWYNNFPYIIHFKDGSSVEGRNAWFEYNGKQYYFEYEGGTDFSSTQSYENQWTVGNTYQIPLTVLGFETVYPAEIIESPVESISFEPITFTKNYGGYHTEDWDEETESYKEYYRYDWWNKLKYTVKLKNGEVLQSDEYGRIYYNGEEFYCNYNDTQSFKNQWGVGNHTSKIDIWGYKADVAVEIIDTPISSISFDPISIIENTNCYTCYEWNDETSESDLAYNYYDWNEYDLFEYTITMKNGQVITGCGESFEYNGEWYLFECKDTQGYQNEWGVGTHDVTASVLGYTANLTVTITESPVESISIEPITAIENYSGWYSEGWDEETESYKEYFRYDWWNRLKYTVTLKSSEILESDENGCIYYNGEYYYCNNNDTQSFQNPWGVGNYTGEINILGYKAEVPVTITPSPITSITVEPVIIPEGKYCGTSSDFNEETGEWDLEYNHYWWRNLLKCTITFEDGSQTTIGSYENFYYNGEWFGLETQELYPQSYQTQWVAGGIYPISASVLGATAEGTVSILSQYTDENFTYLVQGDSAIIIGCNSDETVVTIPTHIGDYPVIGVTGLGCAAEEIIIPDGITSISDEIFYDCYNLKKVTIGADIVFLRNSMFSSCYSLEEIIVSENNSDYTSIDGVVYNKDATKMVAIPLAKTTTHVVPDTATNIDIYINGSYGFAIDLGNSDTGYVQEDGIIYDDEKTIIYSCDINKIGVYDMPDTVTTIGNMAFQNSNLSEVIVSDNVSDIVYYAFAGSINLEKVVLPENLQSISTGAFRDCSNLTDVNLPSNLEIIGEHAFDSSGIVTATVPASVKTISYKAFYNSALTNLTLNEGLQEIEHSAFANSKVKDVTLPDSLSTMGGYAFAYTPLSSVTIGTGLDYIVNFAFYETELTNVVIPSNIEYISECAFANSRIENVDFKNQNIAIGERAFLGCPIKQLKLHEGMTSIERYAFYGISATEVDIPESVTTITYKSFANSKNLAKIDISNNIQSLDGYAFHETAWYNAQKDGVVYLEDSLYHYKGTMPKNTRVIVKDGTKLIANYAFDDQVNLKSIAIPESVTIINECALYKCPNVTVYGYANSSAEAYANLHEIPFINIKDSTKNKCEYTNACDTTCNICGLTRKISHNYAAATCKAPKTCKVCGVTSGSKGTHSYNSGKVTKAATCKATGVKTYTCKVCKTTKTSTIAKLTTHTYKTTTTKATLSKNGKVVKKCTVCSKVASTTTIKYAKTFKLSATSYTYDGKVKTPTVTVKDSAGNKLKKNVDYTLTSSSGRKNVGTYKVTIKMKGKYSGTKTLTFKINPASTKVSKLTAGKKSITVNISKKSTQVTGYQVQYSTSKKFTSAKTKTISSYKTTKYTLKSLSAKKTYYVRVRTYKTVGGKKYYSGWSTVKSVKTK